MRQTTETRHLPCVLTEEELAERAQSLADSVREEEEKREAFAAWEDTMKQAKKAHLGRIAIAHDDTVKFGEIVETGKESRDVPCTWLYGRDAAFLKRDDTGELVQVRQLRPEETQAVIGETSVVQEPAQRDLEEWAEKAGATCMLKPGEEGSAEIRFPSGVAVDLDDKDAAEREMTAFIKEAWHVG